MWKYNGRRIATLWIVLACFGNCVVSRTSRAEAKSEGNGPVLRHAVFFKFKDGASKEEVKSIVDAFRALPAKIKEIQGLALGESLPNSERDDGFTHAFLLTFKDEKGRDAYLPHPAHQEFVQLLRPHLDKAFVIDYWGQPQNKLPERALKHAAFFKFNDSATEEDIKAVENTLAALPGKVDEIKGFEWGTNNSPEKHDEGFTHCFMLTFESEKELRRYAREPALAEAVNELLPKVEKVRIIDFNAEEAPTK